jgi:hypothetical protein
VKRGGRSAPRVYIIRGGAAVEREQTVDTWGAPR